MRGSRYVQDCRGAGGVGREVKGSIDNQLRHHPHRLLFVLRLKPCVCQVAAAETYRFSGEKQLSRTGIRYL